LAANNISGDCLWIKIEPSTTRQWIECEEQVVKPGENSNQAPQPVNGLIECEERMEKPGEKF
jgi:hypothetical protein